MRLKNLALTLVGLLCFAFFGKAQTYMTLPYYESFEGYWDGADVSNQAEWTNFPVNQVEMRDNDKYTGSYSMRFQPVDDNGGNFYYADADLHLDLSGHDQVRMDFWMKENNAEEDRDSIWFSDNGGLTWKRVYAFLPQTGGYPNNSWHQRIVQVDSLAAAYGVSLTSTFVIRFRWYDDRNNDRFYIDDIHVYSETEVDTQTVSLCPDGTSWSTIPDLSITEGGYVDFDDDGTERTATYTLPTGFRFDPAALMTLDTVPATEAYNVKNRTISVSADSLTLTINFKVDAADAWYDLDGVILKGVRVMALPSAQNDTLYRTGGTWDWFGNNPSDSVPHVILNVSRPIDSLTQTDLLCFNDSSGTARVHLNVDSTLLTIAWNNGDSEPNADSLKAGYAVVSVTDASSCVQIDSILINEPALITFSLDSTDVTCNGAANGTATLSGASGGTGGRTYTWSNGDTGWNADSLGSGYVYVDATDANSCLVRDSILINEPTAISVTVTDTTMVKCKGLNGGSAVFAASGGVGGFTYEWFSDPALSTSISTNDTAKNLSAGRYYMQATDANLCTLVDSIDITEPATGITLAVVDSALPRCFGDSTGYIQVSASGGVAPYSYSWSNGDTLDVADTLKQGWHDITVTDDSACFVSDTFYLDQPALLTSTFTDTSNVLCNGDSTGWVVASGLGGAGNYSYSWDNGDNIDTAKVLKAQQYKVTITDDSGCVALDSITITQPSALSVSFVDTFNVKCNGGSDGGAIADGLGGVSPYNHFWETGTNNDTISNLLPGEYTDTVRDANGCIAIDSVVITEPATLLSASIVGSGNNVCFGENKGWAKVEGTNGDTPYSYEWYLDSNKVSSIGQTVDSAVNLYGGLHFGFVIDANGCEKWDSVRITEPASGLDFTFVDSLVPSCYGDADGQLSVVATPGYPNDTAYTYAWSHSGAETDTIGENLSSGMYTVVVTDTVGGCTSTDSIYLGEPTPLVVYDSVLSNYNGYEISCADSADGSIEAYATGGNGGYSYVWYHDPGPATPTGDTGPVISGLIEDDYYVQVTDSKGCQADTGRDIFNPTAMISSSTVTSSYSGFDVSCVGSTDGSAIFKIASGGAAPFNYAYYTDPGLSSSVPGSTNDTIVNNLTSGYTYVSVTDANGCPFVDSFALTSPTALVAYDSVLSNYNGSHVTCTGDSDGQLEGYATGGVGGYSYAWYDDAGLSSWTGDSGTTTTATLDSGTYYLQVTDANGCTDDTSVAIVDPGRILANFNYFHPTSPTANDGYVASNPTLGTGPYTHSWNGLYAQSPSGDSIYNLGSGLYVDTIRDANMCMIYDSIRLIAKDSLDPGIITYPGAAGGIVNVCNNNNVVQVFQDSVTATGGDTSSYVYTWQYSTDLANWINFPSSDSVGYALFDTVKVITAVRREITDGTNTEFSNILLLVTRDSSEVSLNMDPTYCDNIGDQIIFGNPTTNSTFSMAPNDLDGFDSTYAPGQARLVLDSLSPGQKIVTFRHRNTYGCISSITDTTLIYDAVDVAFDPSNRTSFSSLEPAYSLITNTTLGGGVFVVSSIFEGPGASNSSSSWWQPSVAGTGTHNITFTAYDNQGCSDRDTLVVDVSNVNGAIVIDSIESAAGNDICEYSYDGKNYQPNNVDIVARSLPSTMVPGSGSWSSNPLPPYWSYGSYYYINQVDDSSMYIRPWYWDNYNTTTTYTLYFNYLKVDTVTNDTISVQIEKEINVHGRQSIAMYMDSLGGSYDYEMCESDAPRVLVVSPSNSESQWYNVNSSYDSIGTGPFVYDSTGFGTFYPDDAIFYDEPATLNQRNYFRYEYIHPNTGLAKCVTYSLRNIRVYDIDTVSFHLKNSDYRGDTALFSDQEAPYILNTANTGFDPDSLSILNVSYIGDPSLSGADLINDTTYSTSGLAEGFYTLSLGKNSSGCSYYDTVTVEVRSAKANILGLDPDSIYCYNEPIDTLTGVPLNGLSGYGWFTGTPIDTSIAMPADQAILDPTELYGTYTITYHYIGIDTVTEFTVDSVIYVDYVNNVNLNETSPGVWNLDSNLCSSDSAFILYPNYPDSLPSSYNFWSTTAGFVVGDTLYPATGTIAGKDTVYFSYTHNFSGCLRDTFEVTSIYPEAVIGVNNLDTHYCEYEGMVQIIATSDVGPMVGDSNAIYGSGVLAGVVNDTIYNINMMALHYGDFNLTYRYEDSVGCFKDTTYYFHVDSTPYLEFNQISPDYCWGTGDTIITGQYYNNTGSVFAPRGYFYGNDVSELDGDSNNASATLHIDSVIAGMLSDPIYYAYVDPNTGCGDTISYQTQVDTVPVLAVDSLDPFYCNESTTIDQLYPSHKFIPGITDLITIADTAGTNRNDDYILATQYTPGPVTIHYEVTDGNDCYNDMWDTTQIQPTPVTNFGWINNCAEDTIFFFDSSRFAIPTTDTIAAWDWNLGGQADSIQNPNRVFSFSGTYTIQLTAYSNYGCQSSEEKSIGIDPLPLLQVFTESNYCDQTGDTLIMGLADGDTVGYFYGNDIVDPDSSDGFATFLIDSVAIPPSGGYSDPIYYTFTTAKGCTRIDTFTLKVDSLPNVFVTGIDSFYCNEVGFQFPGFAGYPENLPANYYLYQYDTLVTDSIRNDVSGTNIINPSSQGLFNWIPGKVFVFYEYTDGNGCYSNYTDSTVIHPTPNSNFIVNEHCAERSVIFEDNSTINLNFASSDSIVQWAWHYGDNTSDNLDTVYVDTTSHTYTLGANELSKIFPIDLEVVTNYGCRDILVNEQIELGKNPGVDFEWYNECFDATGTKPVLFTNLSDSTSTHNISGVAVDSSNSYWWDFDDAGATDTNRHSQHVFPAVAPYNIRLYVTNRYQCTDSLMKTLNIRPYIDTFQYFQDFETGDLNNGWFEESPDTTTMSWMLGDVNKKVMTEPYGGAGNSWVTSDTGAHYDSEDSYVVGPCFDFRNMERPMLVMKVFNQTDNEDDGAVFQYSIDGGTTWQVLGGIGTGINWYNSPVFGSNPGNQPTVPAVGWSGEDSTRWIEVRHDLDTLIGYDNVRLRVAFASNGNGTNEGFAFDNVWIGERSRTVLYEHFTNSSTAQAVASDNHLNNMTSIYDKDIIDIQYHIQPDENAVTDPMYADNVEDANGRKLYYGIFDQGQGVMDGNKYQDSTINWTSLDLKLRRLIDAPFDISVSTDINGGHSVNVEPTITALDSLEVDEYSVQIAVLEKEITGLVGDNGQTNFKSVMKKMLPNSTGTLFSQGWSVGESVSFREGWTMNTVYDQSQVEVVVFVQNNITKEVYQTVAIDTFVNSTNVPENFEMSNNFVLYPNPTNGNASLLMSKPLENNANLEVFDEMGRLVMNKELYKGVNLVKLETSELSSGMYMVRVRVEGTQIMSGKLKVMH